MMTSVLGSLRKNTHIASVGLQPISHVPYWSIELHHQLQPRLQLAELEKSRVSKRPVATAAATDLAKLAINIVGFLW